MQDAVSWMSTSWKKRCLILNGCPNGCICNSFYFLFFCFIEPTWWERHQRKAKDEGFSRAGKRRTLIQESKCGHAPRQTYLYKRGGAGKVQEMEREREKKLKPKQNQKRGREKKKGPQRIPLTSRDSCTGAGMHTEGSSEPTIQLKWSLEPAPAPADAYLIRIPKSSDSKMLNRQLVDCMDSVWQDDDLQGKEIPLINAPQCVYHCPKGLLVCLRWRHPNSLTHFTGAQQGARTDVHQLMQGATTTPPRYAPRTNGVNFGREANKYSKHEQRVALYNDEESRLASGETMSPS